MVPRFQSSYNNSVYALNLSLIINYRWFHQEAIHLHGKENSEQIKTRENCQHFQWLELNTNVYISL